MEVVIEKSPVSKKSESMEKPIMFQFRDFKIIQESGVTSMCNLSTVITILFRMFGHYDESETRASTRHIMTKYGDIQREFNAKFAEDKDFRIAMIGFEATEKAYEGQEDEDEAEVTGVPCPTKFEETDYFRYKVREVRKRFEGKC